MDQAYSYVTGEVNLTCEAVAEPHANFTWVKDSEVIVPSDTVQIFNDDHKSVLKVSSLRDLTVKRELSVLISYIWNVLSYTVTVGRM